MKPVRIYRKKTSGQTAQTARIPEFQLNCVKDQIFFRFRRGATEKSIAQKFGGRREDVERVIRETCRTLWSQLHGPDSWIRFACLGVR